MVPPGDASPGGRTSDRTNLTAPAHRHEAAGTGGLPSVLVALQLDCISPNIAEFITKAGGLVCRDTTSGWTSVVDEIIVPLYRLYDMFEFLVYLFFKSGNKGVGLGYSSQNLTRS